MALRKAAYILIFSAIIANALVAFLEGGFHDGLDRMTGPDTDILPVSTSIEVPFPGDGDICTYEHSLGLSMVRTTGAGTESGVYLMDGKQVRRWSTNSVDRDLSGIHVMSYVPAGGQELIYEGRIVQNSRMERGPDGTFIRQVRGTSLSFDPSMLGPSMDSEIEVISFMYTEPWEDKIWTGILDSNRTFTGESSGSFSLSLVIEEADLSVDNAVVEWSVSRLEKSKSGTWADIEARLATDKDMEIFYTLRFFDKVPWPVLLDLDLVGSYGTDEGPIEIELALSKAEIGRTKGDGDPVSLLPARPGPSPGSNLDIRTVGTVPAEGNRECALAFTPEEALEYSRSRTEGLQAYLSEHPDAKMFRGSYFRNETALGVTLMVWNITLSAGGNQDNFPGYFFEVGMTERGSVGDNRNMILLHEGAVSCAGASLENSRSLTLSSHEEVIMGDELLSEVFFEDGYYIDTYSLGIYPVGGDSTKPFTAMARYSLGMGSSGPRNLYMSRSQDPDDQKISYISVVDGSSGQLITRTVENGGYVNLLETMELI